MKTSLRGLGVIFGVAVLLAIASGAFSQSSTNYGSRTAIGIAGNWMTLPVPSTVTNLSGATNIVAAGTVIDIYNAKGPFSVYVSATGTAATTNGTLTVYLCTASGDLSTTNEFESVSTTMYKLSTTTLGAQTLTFKDWFEAGGARYIRFGGVDTTFAGPVTGLSVKIGVYK